MKRHVISAVISLVLFLAVLLLVRTVDVAAIGPEGTSVGLSGVNGAVHEATGFRMALFQITEYLGYLAIALAGFFACVGLVQLLRRRSLKRVDAEILTLAALYVLLAVIYVLFEKVVINYRPIVMPGDSAPEASFPSSHTMLACVIFVSAAMLVPRYVRSRSVGVPLMLLLTLLSVVTVVLRLLSGVHWLTDIVAGALISDALLELFAAVLGTGGRGAHEAVG